MDNLFTMFYKTGRLNLIQYASGAALLIPLGVYAASGDVSPAFAILIK